MFFSVLYSLGQLVHPPLVVDISKNEFDQLMWVSFLYNQSWLNGLFIVFWHSCLAYCSFHMIFATCISPCIFYSGLLFDHQVHSSNSNFGSAVFEPYKDSKVELLGPKLLFIALNLGGLALGVWKVRSTFNFSSFVVLIVLSPCFNFQKNKKAYINSSLSLSLLFLGHASLFLCI